MTSDRPKRFESELTVVIDRDKLPPTSSSKLAASEDIMLTDMLAEAERVRMDAEDAVDTLVPCPGPCRTCPCCRGQIMVSAERAVEWMAEHPAEPPPSRPGAA